MTSEEIERALVAPTPPGQSRTGGAFAAAVRACLAHGSVGETLLLEAFPKVGFERKLTIVSALSHYRTNAAARLFADLAADRGAVPSLRCAAIWALARLRRPEDGKLLISLLTDPTRDVRHQALVVLPYHGAAVPPSLTLQLLHRLVKRKARGTFTELIALVSLIGLHGSETPEVFSELSSALAALSSRLTASESEWLQSHWPAVLLAARKKTTAPPLTPSERSRLERWWDQESLFEPPIIP